MSRRCRRGKSLLIPKEEIRKSWIMLVKYVKCCHRVSFNYAQISLFFPQLPYRFCIESCKQQRTHSSDLYFQVPSQHHCCQKSVRIVKSSRKSKIENNMVSHPTQPVDANADISVIIIVNSFGHGVQIAANALVCFLLLSNALLGQISNVVSPHSMQCKILLNTGRSKLLFKNCNQTFPQASSR